MGCFWISFITTSMAFSSWESCPAMTKSGRLSISISGATSRFSISQSLSPSAFAPGFDQLD